MAIKLIRKEDSEPSLLKKCEVSFKATDDEDRVVYGEVYAPNDVDTQNDFAPAEVIKDMAWDFLSSGKVANIDVGHDFKISGARVVESFIAKEGDPIFTEGAWVLATQLPEELWEQVKAGKLNGYSLAGFLTKYPITVDVVVETKAQGDTLLGGAKGETEHSHPFTVLFDEEGEIIFGVAFKGDTDHEHPIKRTTATEEAQDHAHRFVV